MKLENYELEKCLGKGAFGEVYLTSKKDDPKKYATKKMDREEIEKGDAILYKNMKKGIKEGDVIVFKRDNIRVVHRVISVKNINHQIRLYTKGDTNPTMDDGYVTEDTLVGKVMFKIKYIGLPSLWFRKKFE